MLLAQILVFLLWLICFSPWKKISPLEMGKTIFFSKWFMKRGILQRKKSFLLASPACPFCSLLPFAQLPPASCRTSPAVPFYNLIVPGMPGVSLVAGAIWSSFSLFLCIINLHFQMVPFSSKYIFISLHLPQHTYFVELTLYPNLAFFFCPKFHTCIF